MGANTAPEYLRLAGFELPGAGSITEPIRVPGSILDVTSPSFGAVGDGTTDDGPAIQRAVDSLVDTGGVIWLPPGKNYAIGTKVTIASKYPIWIKSCMAGSVLGGGAGTTHADSAVIRPLATLADYMLEWTTPAGLTWGESGGGGVEGLNFADWIMPATYRTISITAAINVHCSAWRCHDTHFNYINGSAIRFGTTVYSQLRNIKVYVCGATGKPPIDVDGGGSNALVWIDRAFIEACNFGSAEPWVRANTSCVLNLSNAYFEGGSGVGWESPSGAFVDGTDGGSLIIDSCIFNGTSGTSVILGADQCVLRNSSVTNFPVGVPAVHVLAAATKSQLSNLKFSCATDASMLLVEGANAQISDCYFGGSCGTSPVIDMAGSTGSVLSNPYLYLTAAQTAGYAIDLASNHLAGGVINGNSVAACDGVLTVAGVVQGVEVFGLDDGDAFTATGALSQFTGNRAYSLGTGTAFVYFGGNIASGNFGYTTTATATGNNTTQTATLNSPDGVITTGALTTAASSETIIVVNNSLVVAASRVFAFVQRGTDGIGRYLVKEVVTGGGQFNVPVQNAGASAFTGTIKLSFLVVN